MTDRAGEEGRSLAADLRRDFGGALRRLREGAGLSLQELGSKIGLGTSALSDLELGKRARAPDGAMVARIVEVCLDCLDLDLAIRRERERHIRREYLTLVDVLDKVTGPGRNMSRTTSPDRRQSIEPGAGDGDMARSAPFMPTSWARVRLLHSARTSGVLVEELANRLGREGCDVVRQPAGMAPSVADGQEPFGFDADLFVLNAAAMRDDDMLDEIERSARRHIPGVPIYESHVSAHDGMPRTVLELLRARGLHLTGERRDLAGTAKELVQIICEHYLHRAHALKGADATGQVLGGPASLDGSGLVVFVGPALLPAAQRVRARLDRILTTSGGLLGGGLGQLELLQHFAYRFGRSHLVAEVRAALAERQQPLPMALRQVLTSPVQILLATHPDPAVESVLRASGWQVIDRPRDAPEEMSSQSQYYVSLAGSFDEPDDLLLSRQDVERQCLSRWASSSALTTLLSTRTVAFVGYDGLADDLAVWYTSLIRPLDRRGAANWVLARGDTASSDTPYREDLRVVPVREDGVTDLLVRLAGSAVPVAAANVARRQPPNRRPYKFLDYFEEDDAEIYFGREAECRNLFSKILSSRLTLLYGMSGTGKTSLINAGLRPLARAHGFVFASARLIQEPVETLRATVRSCLPEDGSVTGSEPVDDLATRQLLRRDARLIIAFDQFEELFVHHGREVIADFARELGLLHANPYVPIKFLLSIREDYLPLVSGLDNYVPDVFRSYLRLLPLTSTQALDAVVKPAEQCGLAYEQGLAERIVSDLTFEGVEPPQLQIVCDQLAGLATGGVIPAQAYDRLGGARGVLGDYTNEVIRRLPHRRRSLAIVVLKHLVTSHGTKDSITIDTMEHRFRRSQRDIDDVLGRLINDRLVRRVEDAYGTRFELTHDYLAHEIRSWLADAEIQQKAALHLLGQELETWQRHGTVMDADRFRIVDEQLPHIGPQLTGEEAAYGLLCSIQNDMNLERWLGLNLGNGRTEEFLRQALEETRLRRISLQLCTYAIGYLGLAALTDQALAVLRTHGNPHLFGRLTHLASTGDAGHAAFSRRAVSAIRARAREGMVAVEAGPFIAGTPHEEIEQLISHYSIDPSRLEGEVPRRSERLGAFLIDVFPVTNAEYQEFDPNFTFPEDTDQHPAVNLNFGHAQAYARWWGKELPTELEWERAARGTDGRRYPWGEEWDSGACNTDDLNLGGSTPVDAFPRGVSPVGCWDMGGNVWEWVDSWFDERLKLKVCKGGGWAADRLWVRGAARHRSFISSQFHLVGFRCVISEPDERHIV
ncbi:SUMF1/EgtB/PvdO family nonheme iron enzyme [Micromonospora sp. NPDC047527]|uniref:nSTAND1 domain-containing NTPase n=1 Tax=Micromonospora sp. NPDC047527 TaxID=3155144 RepID=UPI0033C3F62C